MFQAKLPKLPVPLLERTTKLYLETLKPILNDKQHEHVRKLVADFTGGPGPMLQEILIERREEHENWVRTCTAGRYLLIERKLLQYTDTSNSNCKSINIRKNKIKSSIVKLFSFFYTFRIVRADCRKGYKSFYYI